MRACRTWPTGLGALAEDDPEEVREHFEREWERYCEEYRYHPSIEKFRKR